MSSKITKRDTNKIKITETLKNSKSQLILKQIIKVLPEHNIDDNNTHLWRRQFVVVLVFRWKPLVGKRVRLGRDARLASGAMGFNFLAVKK